MPFTPNMPQWQIDQLDEARGQGDQSPLPNYHAPKNAEPWKTKTPVNKNNMMNNVTGKDYLAKLIEHNQKKKQLGIQTVSLNEAGMSKKSFEDPDNDGDKDRGPGAKPHCEACEHNEGAHTMHCSYSKIDKSMSSLYKYTESKVQAPSVQETVEKALTTQSMPQLRPTPYFDTQRSAQTVTTRAHSRLYGPDGVAPLIGETYSGVNSNEQHRTQPVVKSCLTHGISYTNQCFPCTMNKSMSCAKCGAAMVKSYEGLSVCEKACGYPNV